MLTSIAIDLRQAATIDPLARGMCVNAPTLRSQGSAKGGGSATSSTFLGALDLAASLDPQTAIISDVLNVARKPPKVRAQLPPSAPSCNLPSTPLTAVIFVQGNASLGIFGVMGMAGIYGSTTGEWGFLDGGGGGFMVNLLSAAAGVSVLWMFGPPSSVAGLSFSVGGSWGKLPGPGVSINFSLVFATNGDLGIAYGLQAGFGLFNFDGSLMASGVKLHPWSSPQPVMQVN